MRSFARPRRPTAPAAACGLIAPAVFVGVVLVLAGLQPGYEHTEETISLLGMSGRPHAWVMNLVGFGVSGLLVCVFSLAFIRRCGPSLSAIVATVAWLLVGLAIEGLGAWPAPHAYHLECVYYASMFAILGVGAGSLALVATAGRWLWLSAALAVLATVSYLGLLPLLPGSLALAQLLHVGGVTIWMLLAAIELRARPLACYVPRRPPPARISARP